MRSKGYRIALAAVAIMVIITAILAINYNTNQDSVRDSNAEEAAYQYMLKEYQGKIGVYKIGDSEPFMELDAYIETLPEVDRQELTSTGIIVKDDYALQQIIEDYDS